MASVALLLISSSPAMPMEAVGEVRAVPGRGLVGDRYYEGCGTFSPAEQKPDFELTLIEAEQMEGFVRESGLALTAQDVRRNVVTRGVDLNGLAGRDFFVGEVKIRGLRLCEPCSYLARITRPEVLRGLVHKGGLRAQILTEGMIRCGDEIRVE